MVFLIQNTQNRDSKALHLKLDELLRANRAARNTLVDLENMSDDELQELQDEFARLREMACEEAPSARRAREQRVDKPPPRSVAFAPPMNYMVSHSLGAHINARLTAPPPRRCPVAPSLGAGARRGAAAAALDAGRPARRASSAGSSIVLALRRRR